MKPINIYGPERVRTFVHWINWELRKGRSTIRVSEDAQNLLDRNLLKNVLEVLTGHVVSFNDVQIENQELCSRAYATAILKAYNLSRDEFEIWLKKPWNEYEITHVILFILVSMNLKHKYPMQFNLHGHQNLATGFRIRNTLRAREKIRYLNTINPRSLADSVNSWSQERFKTQKEHNDLVNLVKRIDRTNYKQLIFIGYEQGIIPELFLYQNLVLNSAAYQKSEEYKNLWEFASISTHLEIREELEHEEHCLNQLQELDAHWNIHSEREGVKFSYNQMSLSRVEMSIALNNLAEALPSGKSISSLLSPCLLSQISKAFEKILTCFQKAKEKETFWENQIIGLILKNSSIPSSETSGDGTVTNSATNTIEAKVDVQRSNQQKQIPPQMSKPESPIRKRIKKNLKSLCECTSVNEELLTCLIADRTITYELKDKLTESKSEIKKASILYRFCENSVSDEKLHGLIIALRDSLNTRALQFLQEEEPSSRNSSDV